ncbi:MAG: acyl carrier protein [Fibrobacterota bacterium]|nr:acyl carrier protein [Fibrobacterota bacterium]
MVIQDEELRGKIREYMLANFVFGDSRAGFKDGDSFLDGGIVDSTGVLMVVEYVQEAFLIKVEDVEMIPENLDSIDNLVGFIRGKLPA